jgi:peptidoglycan/LPS O-acetylase OafA/YrhL
MSIAVGGGTVNAAEKGHIPALDGVRGLAILMVLFGHFFLTNNVSSNPVIQVVLDLRNQMWIGVTLFFSLSGFLITGILFDTLDCDHYLRTFYGRRVLRIFPVYYGFLLLLLILTPMLHFNWHGQAWRLWTYTVNIPFTQDWTANPSPYINLRHFWSLAVEEQFYLIWPLLVLWLRTWRKIVTVALSGAVLALLLRTGLVVAHMGPGNHGLPFCMDGLLLGATLALLVRSSFRDRVVAWGPWIFTVSATIILGAGIHDPFLSWSDPVFTTIGMSVIALGTTALVAASLDSRSLFHRIFSARVLRFFGTYSYGIYVYHYSVDAMLSLRLRYWWERHGATKPEAVLLAAIPGIVISVVLAVLSYRLYEIHFLRLKRFFPYQRTVWSPMAQAGRVD